MVLRSGDKGEAVKELQRGLNKLGSMLLIDGQFGPGTRDAVVDARVTLDEPGPPEADDDLQAAIAAAPDLFPPLTAAGVTFIARAEVSSARAYRQQYQTPTWPTGKSGITIGIGYDCQFVSQQQFEDDWAGRLPQETIDRLVPALGNVGSRDLLDQVRSVVIPLPVAMSVFAQRSLDHYLGLARSIYPTIDGLPPARRTALVSLVYNRGTRLTDRTDGREDRREMRTMRDLLASNDPAQIDTVANQLDSMARLWTEGGLIRRRHDEATLWRGGFSAVQLD